MSGNQKVNPPRNFKFFRICFPGFANKLSLPNKFVKYFIEENSSWVTIFSPLGKSWHVKVHGDSKRLHFAEGWEKFAAAHKLSLGDFLVFEYKGGLVFDVNIFDTSTCEKDYSAINGVPSDVIRDQEESCKREFECFREQTTNSCHKRTAALLDQPPSKRHRVRSKEQLIDTQKQDFRAREATKGGKSGFSFAVTIKPYHKYSLELPSCIGKSSIALSSNAQLLLCDPKGYLWPVNLVHRQHATQKHSSLNTGWRDFHVGNNLEAGDVCVFELKGNNKMHVQICRRGSLSSMKIAEDGGRRPKKLLLEKTTPNSMKDSQSMDISAQFKSTIVPSGRRFLYIPKSFLSTVDLSAVREVILVDPCSRRWPVKIWHSKKGTSKCAYLGSGWQAFCDANSVKVGDVCLFKVKSGLQKFTFQVEVITSKAD